LAPFKVGEKDREGRQKRIEHTGPYLRASRTGGVALRAQGRVGAINVTGNTRHGVRVSTRLAKNTQVAFQNGRFVLRGRYGSDAAKLNVSKSGFSISSKTPIGAVNWIRPGSSSAKIAGVQVRGQKALYLHAIYSIFMAAVLAVQLVFLVLGGVVQLVAWLSGKLIERAERAKAARERLDISVAEVAPVGERLLAEHGVELAQESRRDIFAALVFCMVALGRGRTVFDRAAAGMPAPETAAAYALAVDVGVVGEQVAEWLDGGIDGIEITDGTDGADGSCGAVDDGVETLPPEVPLGIAYVLARAFASRVDEAGRAETLLSLDDACLAAGPRTRLQEAMLDVVAEGLGVEILPGGEA
jgi:hypothetical protein